MRVFTPLPPTMSYLFRYAIDMLMFYFAAALMLCLFLIATSLPLA